MTEQARKVGGVVRTLVARILPGSRRTRSPDPAPPPAPPAEGVDPAAIVVRFPTKGPVQRNWGDKLNRDLVEALSRKRVVTPGADVRSRNNPVYLVIGSGISGASSADVVWGMGFLAHTAKMRATPREICAVRGPMTRRKLVEAGIPCPEVYGDPALLYPLIYRPSVAATHDYGIIPHFRDVDAVMPTSRRGASIKIIDITGGIRKVVDEIMSCRMILSSSLHGIIAAHAYGVPSTWIKLSDLPLGDGFKFQDYWSSVGVDDVEPVPCAPGSFCEDLVGPDRPTDPLVDPRALIEACPFIHPDVRARLLRTFASDGLGLLAAGRARR